MILDLAAQNPLFAQHLNFTEGRPAAVLAAQFYADSADELAERARRPGRQVRGAAGRARRPHQPDRRRQGRLLEDPQGRVLAADGDGRRRQADRVRRGHGRRSRSGSPSSTTGSARSSTRQGVAAACYGHADVGCLHIRPIINVKTGRGSRRSGRSPGRSPTWSSSSAAR